MRVPAGPDGAPPDPLCFPCPLCPSDLQLRLHCGVASPQGALGCRSPGGWERGQFSSRSPPPAAEVCASVLGTQVPHWSQYIIITLGKSRRAYEVENCISFVLNLPNSKSSGRCFYFTYLLTVCSLLPQNAEYTIGIRFSFWS